ncbi:hypothetical protein LMG28138_03372 [Pararobbsia alpina]|uniref:Uncharacterized protein n=1 Tax=Pararobbsia alpina TaxID=621374 RepID=A0A6S7CLC8_9BURK|nr:hypothetical protein LMG28138_03372 [Pararobbsia alpina]
MAPYGDQGSTRHDPPIKAEQRRVNVALCRALPRFDHLMADREARAHANKASTDRPFA